LTLTCCPTRFGSMNLDSFKSGLGGFLAHIIIILVLWRCRVGVFLGSARIEHAFFLCCSLLETFWSRSCRFGRFNFRWLWWWYPLTSVRYLVWMDGKNRH
jgi:hypothetical protein